MTTAHRPTWHPAIGRAESGGFYRLNAPRHQGRTTQVSYTTLKYRQRGQNAPEEIARRDLRQELENREQAHTDAIEHTKKREGVLDARENVLTENAAPAQLALDDAELAQFAMDRDVSDDEESDDEDMSDSSDEDDEEAELMRELEKIKAEREAQRQAEAERKAAEDARRREEEIAVGNPQLGDVRLGGARGSFSVKQRWNDDVIFRHQARDEDVAPKKRFVNDTIRSDFHRKFMSRFIK
jgi:protein CWC15